MTTGSDWTGTVGDVWTAEWQRTDRSFADLSRHLDAAILAAAPAGPFSALDIGCGAGGTSLALAEVRPDASILGVDLSAGLVKVACDRASTLAVVPGGKGPRAASEDLRGSGLSPAWGHGAASEEVSFDTRDTPLTVLCGNISFETGDATTVAGRNAPFDLLYSRHGVMFFDDPVAAFTALHAAAAPGARLVFSCFAEWSDNAFASEIARALGLAPPSPRAPGPFAFQDESHVRSILTDAGVERRDGNTRALRLPRRRGGGRGGDRRRAVLLPTDRSGRGGPARRGAVGPRGPDRPSRRRHPTPSHRTCHRLSGVGVDMVCQSLNGPTRRAS